MWRARLLTLAAVTAAVADRALRHLDGGEDARLESRLTFERLAVSAVVRATQKDPRVDRSASRRLAGSDLARAALAAGEPLTRHNFLKGQAVNGPYGVISRLALHLGLIDADGRLGQNGTALLLAWAEDVGLSGILDEEESRRPGAAWAEEAARQVGRWIQRGEWPGPLAGIWQRLADVLRLDRMGVAERCVITRLLAQDSVRGRVLAILRERAEIYRQHAEEGRGVVERVVLLQAVRPILGDNPVDRVIRAVCFAVHPYETASVWLQQAFEAILWGLKHLGGRAAPADLLSQPAVLASLEKTRTALRAGLRPLDEAVGALQNRTELNRAVLIEPIGRLREDVAAGIDSPTTFLAMLTRRHERVQREKRKGPWLDRDTQWTLLPGVGVGGEQPPEYGPTYIHPFRIVNAYALLEDTGAVSLEAADGEE
jgi:hypothetical protein